MLLVETLVDVLQGGFSANCLSMAERIAIVSMGCPKRLNEQAKANINKRFLIIKNFRILEFLFR